MNAIMEMFETGTAVWSMVDYLFKLTLILGLGCLLYRAISRFPAGSKIQLWKLTFAVVFLLRLSQGEKSLPLRPLAAVDLRSAFLHPTSFRSRGDTGTQRVR